MRASEPEVLWEPTAETRKRANITHYLGWLASRDLHFRDYEELRRWSVRELEKFWETIWEYFGVRASKPYSKVLSRREMPGKWFVGAELNYAANILREKDHDGPAIICAGEGREQGVDLSWEELRTRTSSVAASLTEMGVRKGDRVSAYLPNIPEAVVAFLACASIGATWASCSPDFGAPSVIDRLKQIDPKILIAVDGYGYGGKWFDRLPVLREIQNGLPTLKKTIIISKREREFGGGGLRDTIMWEDLPRVSTEPIFEPLPFDHPLWVLYSSGTTGLPKPIVHGHGGVFLEHLKVLSLHNDLRASDRFFWFTSTGWMMWNYLVGGLLLGSTIILYDGSPGFPDLDALWRMAESTGMTFFGTSAAYITSCMKAGLRPGETHKLKQLRGVGSTGSPLSRDGFRWVYDVKRDVWLASISGGTDLCTAFVGGCPTLPVRAGEIQCRCLGADVQSFDERGKSVVGQVGELVLASPMPSMPLFFWGDNEGRRYRETYFAMFPGVWRHGDWVEITEMGSCIIYGRSDATLKRMGVRMGTSEVYRVVEALPEVADSLAVDLEGLEGRSYMPLFVVLGRGARLDEALKKKIRQKISKELSPRYVPDEIFAVPEIPRTLSGKKLEVPIKKILLGAEPTRALSRDSLSNPDSIDRFVEVAKQLRREVV